MGGEQDIGLAVENIKWRKEITDLLAEGESLETITPPNATEAERNLIEEVVKEYEVLAGGRSN